MHVIIKKIQQCQMILFKIFNFHLGVGNFLITKKLLLMIRLQLSSVRQVNWISQDDNTRKES